MDSARRYAPAVDVFALGVLAAAIFNECEPYDDLTPTEVMAGVLSSQLRPELPGCLTDEVRPDAGQCLDPKGQCE